MNLPPSFTDRLKTAILRHSAPPLKKVRAPCEGGVNSEKFPHFYKKVRKTNPATPPRGTDIHALSLWELAILGSCRSRFRDGWICCQSTNLISKGSLPLYYTFILKKYGTKGPLKTPYKYGSGFCSFHKSKLC